MSLEAQSQKATDSLEQVKRYHQETKHDFNRYARSLGYLDWANQPNPFRRYDGATLFRLPLLSLEEEPVSPYYEDLYHSPGLPPQPLTLKSLSRFFEYALSITAWKEYGGNRWALRSNPSSGNLHPTEGYVFIGQTPDLPLDPGLYHYTPQEHGLEQRLVCPAHQAQQLLSPFPPSTILVGLTSIHWREAWKYGERAFRYCQHDIGHAIGTLRIAAATLGWQLVVLAGMDDHTGGSLLGLTRSQDFDQTEPEFPELIAAVLITPESSCSSLPLHLDRGAVESCVQGTWHGKANQLSRENPIPWEIIDEMTKASWKSSTEKTDMPLNSSEAPLTPPLSPNGSEGEIPSLSAGQIIHQRRSALAFDGKTSIHAARFFTMLQRVMPRSDLPVTQRPMPWDSIPWDPTIHLAMFVHRVDGIQPGLYMLLRDPAPLKKEAFQKAMHEQFLWTTPEGCPPDVPLYLLEDGNSQKIATQVSCWQEIGGDSTFAIGMIAEFEASLDTHGPWFYRRLFWEAGLIGQVLYLEAEAAGVRATGIGCFFDDPVHQVLGFFPHIQYQSLYHFTTGGPVEDRRLTTLPPYGNHETEGRS